MSFSTVMCRVFAPLISRKYYFKYENARFLTHYNPNKMLEQSQFSQLAMIDYLALNITAFKFISTLDKVYLPPDAFPNLTKLHLGNSALQKPYPPKLRKLKIAGQCSKIVQFPDTLTHLWTNFHISFSNTKELPSNLTHLMCGYCYVPSYLLPQTLTHLRKEFVDSSCQVDLPNLKEVSCLKSLQQIHLTSTLTYIQFSTLFNESIDALQNLPNLKTIMFSTYFSQPVDMIPLSVTHLHFGRYFRIEYLLDLPANLHLLILELTYTATNSINFNQVCKLMSCNCNIFSFHRFLA